MSQRNRLDGGLIERGKPLSFSFDGRKMSAFKGDTLASALISHGVKTVARSFKYHRPRGIFTAGSEEPNALVTLHGGAFQEPNSRATMVEVFEGLEGYSQNYMGSLRHDLMAVNDFFAPFLSAGFYYKTFMWPKSFWEKLYEPMIRRSAGLGKLSMKPDPAIYDKGFLHCDLLIIGAGPSGLIAALTAARTGLRVILADEDFVLGGRLNSESHLINDAPAMEWVSNCVAELESFANVRILKRTTVYGLYDHGVFGALERRRDHVAPQDQLTRQVAWRIYTRRAILCAGATERPIAFANNDRPNIMLAGAVRRYINRFAVTPGQDVAIFTNNDDGWRTARDLAEKGVRVAAVIDSRSIDPLFDCKGAMIATGCAVANTKGRHGVSRITLTNGTHIEVDCLAISGGWNPNVHLTCHLRGKPQWRDDIAAFVPQEELPPGLSVAGAANGTYKLADCLQEGLSTVQKALKELGKNIKKTAIPKADDEACSVVAFWQVKAPEKLCHGRAWVDMQNDVTSKDITLAHLEGFRSVEHLKRYTTLGMATDQGKTANVNAIAILAEASGKSIPQTGTTIYRPPYSPVSLGAFAGRARGKHFRPTRHTPSHEVAKKLGAMFVETGMWLRAQWFPKHGETHWLESVDREVLATRKSVGVCDVTTLGKIDIQGKDAGEFLHRVYINNFATLAVGKVRYGAMLREDGIVMDDGTTARLGETHYLMTTTTANAVSVFRHLEFCRQALWPELDVHLISATEQYAQFAVAGPNARKLLQKIIDQKHDISNEAFPYMACGEITLCGGIPGRLFRISFSGELAYEIAVPTRYGASLFEVLLDAGQEFNVVSYGLEALGVMRIEKGHAAGNELCGQTSATHLGLARMASSKKDYIGHVMARRPGLCEEDGWRLCGFTPLDTQDQLLAGSHFIALDKEANTANDDGWMSSVAYSPTLGHYVGLGFIKRGHERTGEIVRAVDLLRGSEVKVKVCSPHFFDPEGERLRV